ncbi:cathepsin L-like proteinase [Sitophilus oryzae]|uniref:Cathepsin L-like proteinase n=1 Tax=Sitophilus oryzae TaxID=7048 RepID=A0A6J2XF70_SITOR|nr:cathepsin L-like proteinase [Sitophilus oryzae]
MIYCSKIHPTVKMRVFILASCLIVAVSASSQLEQDAALFQSFKLEHGKTYNNHVEESARFAIFRENLRTIQSHNARFDQGLESYTQGINQFADMTPAEFKAMLALQLSTKPAFNSNKKIDLPVGNTIIPDSFDWREKNVINPVQDQGTCGACWAFTLVGATEAAYAIKTGNLSKYSEQQLVDCTGDFGNLGCQGGYLTDTFSYIEAYGLQYESDYPYEGANSTCQYNSSKIATHIESYVYFSGSEDALKVSVATDGPVAVAIDGDYIQFYASGIYDDTTCNPNKLDHAVLAVGYGIENGTDYWILKNSWGSSWGESGYIRFLRGVNQCGIIAENTFPRIASV